MSLFLPSGGLRVWHSGCNYLSSLPFKFLSVRITTSTHKLKHKERFGLFWPDFVRNLMWFWLLNTMLIKLMPNTITKTSLNFGEIEHPLLSSFVYFIIQLGTWSHPAECLGITLVHWCPVISMVFFRCSFIADVFR